MRLSRKVIAMAMASMMVFSMTACGGGSSTSETTAATQATTEAATTEAATEAAKETAEETEAKGAGEGGNIVVCTSSTMHS